MVNKKSVIPKKITRNKPAKKRVVEKDPKKGLAGAGEPVAWTPELARVFSEWSPPEAVPLPYFPPIKKWPKSDAKDPLRVAIDKFSLSLVSESMLAMVAMHGILTTNPDVSTQSIAREAVETARAVMAELKKQKEEGAK